MRRLLADDGELLTCVFPIGPRDGGPPFAMSVELVRSLLEPAGFEAALVRDDLPLEEQHRRVHQQHRHAVVFRPAQAGGQVDQVAAADQAQSREGCGIEAVRSSGSARLEPVQVIFVS